MCRRDDWVQTVRDLVPSAGKQDSASGTTSDLLLKVRVRSTGGRRSSVRMHIPANVLHSEIYLGTRHLLHVRFPIYSLPLLLLISCLNTILLAYFHLCTENYNWQWRAFTNSSAIRIDIYTSVKLAEYSTRSTSTINLTNFLCSKFNYFLPIDS